MYSRDSFQGVQLFDRVGRSRDPSNRGPTVALSLTCASMKLGAGVETSNLFTVQHQLHRHFSFAMLLRICDSLFDAYLHNSLWCSIL